MARKSAKGNTRKGASSSRQSKNVEEDMRKVEARINKATHTNLSNDTYKVLAASIAVIIGIILILLNLSGVIEAFIGFIFIYFGLKGLGYSLPMPKM